MGKYERRVFSQIDKEFTHPIHQIILAMIKSQVCIDVLILPVVLHLYHRDSVVVRYVKYKLKEWRFDANYLFTIVCELTT